MMKPRLLVCALLVVATMSPALALPTKSSTGKACESTGTERRDGKDQNGAKLNCLFEFCSWTECNTAGSTVSNCVKKTEYSNPTDCKAAAASIRVQGLVTATTLVTATSAPAPTSFEGATLVGNQLRATTGFALERVPNVSNRISIKRVSGGLGKEVTCKCSLGTGAVTISGDAAVCSSSAGSPRGDTCEWAEVLQR